MGYHRSGHGKARECPFGVACLDAVAQLGKSAR
jgi:hypothetical protein